MLHVLILFLQINFVNLDFNNSSFVLLLVLVHFIHEVMQCNRGTAMSQTFFF